MFVYETFLYVIAALLKANSFLLLKNVFASRYLIAEPHTAPQLVGFGEFEGFSESLHILAPAGRRLLSPAAELIKRQAQRSDLSFHEIMQAELLILLMAFITPEARWFPQTLHYTDHGTAFPFFIRAAQRRHFKNLAVMTGIDSADNLRAAVKTGHERMVTNQWHSLRWDRTFSSAMNLDKLDTLG